MAHEKVFGICENKCKVEVISKEGLWDFIKDKVDAEILAKEKEKYPVGRILMSTKNVNPSTYLGFGTWAAWGSGRVPVGVNTSDSNFNSVEKTGGASTVTLTVNQIPSHNHKYSDGYLYSGEPPAGTTIEDGCLYDDGYHLVPNSTTSSTGGGGSHNNLQPYITCYMWKRTA